MCLIGNGYRAKTIEQEHMIRLCIITFLLAIFTIGCGNRWDSTGAPNIKGAKAMVGVSEFIATNGWNMCTNGDDLSDWDKLSPRYIRDLPWTEYKNKQFWAVTCNGILYVLSSSGWHGDYGGVAYNPMTNHFPVSIEGFKPIGDHWYVWCSLEFPPQGLPQKYE
jgi:hypothetical protein